MKRLTVLCVGTLLLTGCAGGSAPVSTTPATSQADVAGPTETATPTPTVLPAGEFELNTVSGAKIKFTLPTPATDPALAKLEAFRKKTGGKPVSYILADVDNRQGTELVNMYQINVFDKEGREYTFSGVTDVLRTWEPRQGTDYVYRMPDGRVLDEATGSAWSSEGSELYNANQNGADVAERAKIILASADADLPDEFTRVSVQPSGMGQGEDAIPAQR